MQIVYALTIIRKYWMQQNKSVGTPPILVLSYKNHAADEFLSDLLKVTGTLLTGNLAQMVGDDYPHKAPFNDPKPASKRKDK